MLIKLSKQKEEAYKLLEAGFVRYKDLMTILVQESNTVGVIGKYYSLVDMKSVSPHVIIRQALKTKLNFPRPYGRGIN